ncbi:MAG: hypothetical protein ACREDV_00950 [Methylocella sp.]
MSWARAANIENMTAKCSARAAKVLRVEGHAIEVKYEGQRTDKTHAVNGSSAVRGKTKTFQCSFERTGRRITKFIVNAGQGGGASTSTAAGEKTSGAATRAGAGDFDATGRIPCAETKGQPMVQCDFGVSRAGGGSATLVITLPDGRKRTIFFNKGKAISADTSQADGYGEFRARKEGDLFLIRAGEERYEIPEAAITGG